MEIENVEDLYLKLSLYNPINLNKDNEGDLVRLFCYSDDLQFDCYCPECSKESTFVMVKNEFYSKPLSTDSTITLLNMLHRFGLPRTQIFRCQRNGHIFTYNFYFKNSQLIKTGQYPSIADIEIPSIHKYKKLLKRDYNDFSKAIGLHSHGVGAGSFVYLRRIFENLIEEMHIKAKSNEDNENNEPWNEKLYLESRMDEKIKLLKGRLPDILVENRAIYGIMSKGIHELSEDECKTLFPDVKLGIELILDEKLYEQEKQSKRKSFSSFIASTTAKLKS